jgi:hypothetical protein
MSRFTSRRYSFFDTGSVRVQAVSQQTRFYLSPGDEYALQVTGDTPSTTVRCRDESVSGYYVAH